MKMKMKTYHTFVPKELSNLVESMLENSITLTSTLIFCSHMITKKNSGKFVCK